MRKTVIPIGQSNHVHRRDGFITPFVVFALLVVMCCLALVFDRLWLDSTVVELTRGAEAAALRAAKGLASDDRLLKEVDARARIQTARTAAANIAVQNLVAGDPLVLDTSPQGDIRFGRLIEHSETGLTVFLETLNNPTSVVVTAERSRGRGNPIALIFKQLTRQSAGDAVARAEATIQNRIVGVRPFDGVHVPGLPMAILKKAAAGERQDTWDVQIEQRQGKDRYSYNEQAKQVVLSPDGIPEIVLKGYSWQSQPQAANVLLVDLGSDLRDDVLSRQIRNG